MYFVVFLMSPRVYVTIPENWIKDFDRHNEKFLNQGINANQTYVCYYTKNANAKNENGTILLNFTPDFDTNFEPTFPSTGCYLCRIVKARCNICSFVIFIFFLDVSC